MCSLCVFSSRYAHFVNTHTDLASRSDGQCFVSNGVVVGDRMVSERTLNATAFVHPVELIASNLDVRRQCETRRSRLRGGLNRANCTRYFESLSIKPNRLAKLISLRAFAQQIARCQPDDWRYLLTSIGKYAPLFVAQELARDGEFSSFRISGGQIGTKVSWQLIGVLINR